ncbi:MAG TPA: outer membrane beta-barrel protein [Ignavibacteria bacterium]|nr:outer membrane beta-barrel protein [Ignavibacteria bacterium]
MKNYNFIKAIIIFILVLTLKSQSNAQNLYIGPTVGITAPTGDYSGTTMEYYSGTKYGLSTGFNIGALLKSNIGPFILRGSANYSFLNNSGSAEPNDGFIEHKSNIFTLSAGPEFVLTSVPTSIKPYLGADILLSFISGRSTFSSVDFVPDGTFDMQSAARLGLGFGAGFEYSLGAGNILDISIRYNLVNLIGKEFNDVTPSENRRLDSYLSLNDDRDPVNPNDINRHPIGSSRSISTFQFNISYLFGL